MPNQPLLTQAVLGNSQRFEVEVDGISLGAWSKVAGIDVDFETENHREGGTNDYYPILPKGLKYAAVKLTRPVVQGQSQQLLAWLSKMADTFMPTGTAHIRLMDARRQEVMTWTLRNTYPKKYTGPTFDAGKPGVALEELTLQHEGFL